MSRVFVSFERCADGGVMAGVAINDHGSRPSLQLKPSGMACGFLPMVVLFFASLSCLVLAASVQQSWLLPLPKESIGLVEVVPVANTSDAYYAAYIVSAERPFMCLRLYWAPSNGTKLRLWDCQVDKDLITKFLLPVGGQGPIRLLTDPNFCLDAPGDGVLQLWTCVTAGAGKATNMKFVVRAEASAWFSYPHYDLPNAADVEQMDASNLHEVMRHAQEKDYAGFSVFNKKAFLKGVKTMEASELLDMGDSDPCTFYMFRPQGDITFRLARKTTQCMHVLPQVQQPMIGMASCDESNTDGSQVMAMRFGIRHIRLDEETRKHVQNILKPLHLQYAGKSVHPHHTDPPTISFSAAQTGDATTSVVSSVTGESTTRSPSSMVQGSGSAELPGETSDSHVFAMPRIQQAATTSVVILVRNVDYDSLLAKRPLYTRFGQTVSECIAAAAGVDPNSVTWKLEAGSVLVVGSILVPEGMHPSVLHVRLQDSAMTLRRHILARLHRMAGIEAVTTGNLSVSEVRPLGETISPGPPVRLDVILAALILLVAAAVWLWCRVCGSRKQESRKASVQQKESLLTETGVNKSPRARVLVMPASTADASEHETIAIGQSSASTASREAEEQDEAEEGEHDNPFDCESGAGESQQEKLEGPGNPFEVQTHKSSPERGNPFDCEPSVEDKEAMRTEEPQ